jgi:ATP/maltotriose-dependent transcriptional regulator MalT
VVQTVTVAGKSVPPVRPPWLLARPRLESLVESVSQRRLTSVIADAGFGKSTLLAAWASACPSAWYTADGTDADAVVLAQGLLASLERSVADPAEAALLDGARGPQADPMALAETLAATIGEWLARARARETLLVVDDAHQVGAGSSGAHLLDGLVRSVPAWVHVVLGSRIEPPFATERLRGQGQAHEILAASLAFTPDELGQLLASALGPEARDLAPELLEMTGGWPAAVQLAIQALRDVPADERRRAIAALPRHGRLLDYLAQEVLAREPEESRAVLRRMAVFDRLPPGLVSAPGVLTPDGIVPDYSRRGLLVDTGTDGSVTLHWLLRRYLRERLPLPERTGREVHRRAARWLEAHGLMAEALAALREANDVAALEQLLRSRGAAIVESGTVRPVIDALGSLPAARDDPELQLLEGQARMVSGDTQGALACLERAAGTRRRTSAGLAWRMGLLHYLRGDLPEAVVAFARGSTDGAGGDPRDVGLLLAWTATGRWGTGDLAGARTAAARALEVAHATGDDRCLAAANTVLAMLASIDGDSAAMEAHSATALAAAERAGDTLQVIRIRTNRASHRADDGRYADALEDLELAIERAEVSGYAFFLALALSNRGEVLAVTGQLEAAAASYEASLAIYRRMGSRSACYPLQGLGDVLRIRGELALARASYQEALGYAQGAVEWQALAPTLAGLARALPEPDRATAREHADRALEASRGPGRLAALLALGWLAARDGADDASERARLAVEEATNRGDPAGLAEALELTSVTATDDAARLAQLREALQIWVRIGNPVGQARVELAIARLDASEAGRRAADEASGRLAALGVRPTAAAAAAGLLQHVRVNARPAVAVYTLGGFALERDGQRVGPSEWQSRKARDLVKLLIARRGRRIGRETLMELLWPEEPPDRLGNRLSVALATARGVLDRGHDEPANPILQADGDAVWLDREAVWIDVEEFLAAARSALERARAGTDPDTIEALAAAEAGYAGDFLEEDGLADWAVPLREEARATYLSVTRGLAMALASTGDLDAAARYTLRILERDPWDEDAHLLLVSTLDRAGRHGEARRQYRAYVARMRELDVEPVAFPVGSGG